MEHTGGSRNPTGYLLLRTNVSSNCLFFVMYKGSQYKLTKQVSSELHYANQEPHLPQNFSFLGNSEQKLWVIHTATEHCCFVVSYFTALQISNNNKDEYDSGNKAVFISCCKEATWSQRSVTYCPVAIVTGIQLQMVISRCKYQCAPWNCSQINEGTPTDCWPVAQ
jgi:hypothetical protein